ncbi:DUF1631 domain-containing protein [Aestuariirhabdus litorea]|uniref:DUF1631 domain-containing protein n=1 Tax=Aestuariirhabdus litorea TaxID=2528527 RepID=A0A3P3VKK0_9GAMM|nr:DUF1631 domain-containing protein [Aestuariirhabdus litorea]RRJ83271.1 DUF1631 domain-containing protein [Aestuariirhabdus litorea]RWW93430.1 DUF1631 family protein [Endozoicomonadaceae bacterium GTF-13]
MSKTEPPKVVSLQSRMENLDHIQPRFQQLIQACRKITMNSTASALAEMFEHIDDALFDAAEKAENNSIQTLFFDSMREIRLKRPQAERVFHQEISQLFSDFIELKPQGKQPGPAPELDADEMSLVQNEVYEESLVVTNMATKVNGRCTESLYALNQRLAIIINGVKVTEQTNPVAPKKIATSFCRALEALQTHKRIQEILFRLFDEYVMSELDKIYDDLNKRLIQADVLPNLKFSARQYAESQGAKRHLDIAEAGKGDAPGKERPPAQAQSSPSRLYPNPGATPAGAGQPAPPNRGPLASNIPHNYDDSTPQDAAMEGASYMDPAVSDQLFSAISDLISNRRENKMPLEIPEANFRSVHAFSPPEEGLAPYTTDDLLNALTALQKQNIESDGTPFTTPQTVNAFKDSLVKHLGSDGKANRNISPEDADIIDLVGMLFDFILDDENLPDICKTALSHLHTPYLKIALTDKEMFVRHQHPARRLLNSMAQAAVLWAPDEQNDRGVLAKIQYVVQRVINDYAGEIGLFDELIKDFNSFINLLKRQSEIIERRAVEATKGRDRLLAARKKARATLEERIREQQPPKATVHFLLSAWNDVLVFLLLRHGEESEAWQRALNITDDIFWSVAPKFNVEDKDRLKETQPHLITNIKQHLINLGGHQEEDIKGLVKPLVLCQRAALRAEQGKEVEAPEPPPVEEQLEAAAVASLGGLPLDEEEAEDIEVLEDVDVDPALISRLKQVEFGTWFDFVQPDQSLQRLKLSWFSPTTLNYMFVDSAGNKAAVKPIFTLATEITIGSARFASIERAPLMDRAMEKIHNILKLFMGK